MSKSLLIDLLPKKMQELIQSKAELYELNHSELICVADKPIDYLYFPIDGCISIVQRIDERPPLGIGIIGNDGVVGAEITLGASQNSFSAIAQGNGSAWKLKSTDFLMELRVSPELRSIMN